MQIREREYNSAVIMFKFAFQQQPELSRRERERERERESYNSVCIYVAFCIKMHLRGKSYLS
jgi:hypothetical protein